MNIDIDLSTSQTVESEDDKLNIISISKNDINDNNDNNDINDNNNNINGSDNINGHNDINDNNDINGHNDINDNNDINGHNDINGSDNINDNNDIINTEQIITGVEKKYIIKKVKSLEQEQLLEIYKIVSIYTANYTKNNNGVFVNLDSLDNEVLVKIFNYIKNIENI